MICTLLTEIGEHLSKKQNIDVPYGCEVVSAKGEIVIDETGKLIEVRSVERIKSRSINLLSYNDGHLSNSGNGIVLHPHVLMIRQCQLIDDEQRKTIKENVRSLYEFSKIESLYSLIRFLSLTEDILDLKEYSKTDYFRFILRKNDIEEPLSEREDILRWGGRWLKWLITKEPLVYRCDVSGKRTSNAIDSSGRLNNGTTIGTRIYSKTLYNRVYHGKYEEYVSSSVSIETELAMICAYYNLYTNRKLKGCGRVFYLGTLDLEMAFPLHFSVKRISEARGKEIVSEDKWIEEKRQIKEILHDRELIWIEFDSVNLGRISAYQARKLTKGESERITGNILKWIDANTVWTENGPTEILWLSELENSNYHDDRTREDKIFGLYHKIIWGEWDIFLKELFNEKIKCRKHIVDKSINEYVQIYRSLVDMGNIEEDSEFMAGELFALACILESRYFYEIQKSNSYQIRNLFDRYLAQPYTTWILIREIIYGYTNNRSKPLRVITARIIEIETDLINNFQFQKMRVMSGKALIGFDVTTEMYWKKRRNENEEYAI